MSSGSSKNPTRKLISERSACNDISIKNLSKFLDKSSNSLRDFFEKHRLVKIISKAEKGASFARLR